jgi:hypothetical protein
MREEERDKRLHISAKELQRVLALPPTAETVLKMTSTINPGEEEQARFTNSLEVDLKTINLKCRATRTRQGIALEEMMPAAQYPEWERYQAEEKARRTRETAVTIPPSDTPPIEKP